MEGVIAVVSSDAASGAAVDHDITPAFTAATPYSSCFIALLALDPYCATMTCWNRMRITSLDGDRSPLQALLCFNEIARCRRRWR